MSRYGDFVGIVAAPAYDEDFERQRAKWRLRWRHWRLSLVYLGADGFVRLGVAAKGLLEFGQRLDRTSSLVFALCELAFVSFAGSLLFKRIVGKRWRIYQILLYCLLTAGAFACVGMSLYVSKVEYVERMQDAIEAVYGNNDAIAQIDFRQDRHIAVQKLVLDVALDVFRVSTQVLVFYVLLRWLAVAAKLYAPFGTAVEMNLMPQPFMDASSPGACLNTLPAMAMSSPMTTSSGPLSQPLEAPRAVSRKGEQPTRVTSIKSDPFRAPHEPRTLPHAQ
ncbi:hypothetical protein BCR37DRAFT_390150 [Protomyces lactucae-debilis]|uniref:Uncharacterized protein n=1 Tax=Protomyces lactucae-debilis TaxID=2754530 RepID=A0A1Y2FUB6_PROLT|nr:uncharacterized protein BCR37DRAFT_390150 [Protomyces lactucae-debilis]ORY87611.1 hypothetical protein BCR37DRAFT_390150 [Protomyces lactucae-debilis]